jgi:hypothetical protein
MLSEGLLALLTNAGSELGESDLPHVRTCEVRQLRRAFWGLRPQCHWWRGCLESCNIHHAYTEKEQTMRGAANFD